MDEIIQCLRESKWVLTLHDLGHIQCEFVLAVVIDDPTDLWYLAQFCAENQLDMGACFFSPKRGVAYFPRLIVGPKQYGAIVDAPR